MYAPDHPRTAQTLLRRCVPGGRIVSAAWTPDGLTAATNRATAPHPPPPPAGGRPQAGSSGSARPATSRPNATASWPTATTPGRPSEPGWIYLGRRGDPQPRLVFQPSMEHLETLVDELAGLGSTTTSVVYSRPLPHRGPTRP
ncbi:hypothetical protein [Streptomyces sp. NPDC001436]